MKPAEPLKQFFFKEEVPYGLALARICLPLVLLLPRLLTRSGTRRVKLLHIFWKSVKKIWNGNRASSLSREPQSVPRRSRTLRLRLIPITHKEWKLDWKRRTTMIHPI